MARVELRNYRRAQSPLHTLFRLFRYFRHCRVLLICAVASILAYVACTIGASYCMRPLTNLLKESGITPNETYAKYLSLLAGLGTLYFLSAVTNYLLNRLMLETSTVIMRELRAELFARMQKLPISYFDARRPPGAAARCHHARRLPRGRAGTGRAHPRHCRAEGADHLPARAVHGRACRPRHAGPVLLWQRPSIRQL